MLQNDVFIIEVKKIEESACGIFKLLFDEFKITDFTPVYSSSHLQKIGQHGH